MSGKEEELKKIYDPNFFYEHGQNPAYKQLLQYQMENNPEGQWFDYRTYFKEKYTKFAAARNIEDFLQRDLKCVTFTRSAAVFYMTTLWAMTGK
jgi:hypothetical protein